MAKHDARADADGTSLSTSDKGQPVVTYVRVGRGMVKVTKYEKQDKDTREERKRDRAMSDAATVRSFDSSQPVSGSAPSVKSRASSGGNARAMPTWMPKFKKSKKGKRAALDALANLPSSQDLQRARDSLPSSSQFGPHQANPVQEHSDQQHPYSGSNDFASRSAQSAHVDSSTGKTADMLSPPTQHYGHMPTPPSSPTPRQAQPLRSTRSHDAFSSNPHAVAPPPDVWSSIAQLESNLVARYGRGAVPQFDALRERVQQMPQVPQQRHQIEPQRQLTSQPAPVEPPSYSGVPYASGDPRFDRLVPGEVPRAGSGSRLGYQPVPRAPVRAETLPTRRGAPVSVYPSDAYAEELDDYVHDAMRGMGRTLASTRAQEPSPEPVEEEDSDDGAVAYLQALGLDPSTSVKTSKPAQQTKAAVAQSYAPNPNTAPQPRPLLQPVRTATLPAVPTGRQQSGRHAADETTRLELARHEALIASIVNPPPAALDQYASRSAVPRSDYLTTRRAPSEDALGLLVDHPSSRSPSPFTPHTPPSVDLGTVPDLPSRKTQRRDLPPQLPPPNASAPHAPINRVAPLNVSKAQASPKSSRQDSPMSQAKLSPQISPIPRSQNSPMSLAPPLPHAPRSTSSSTTQLALPLVRVRITSPPHHGALRSLPALIQLSVGARTSFAAATWAQMVAYCARNAGVTVARRGGGGVLRVVVEERMAELMTPGGGRGVGDEEIGFGLGYYVSVEMALDGESTPDEPMEGSVPVATLTIPLPTTMGEVATLFRERKDIRRALS